MDHLIDITDTFTFSTNEDASEYLSDDDIHEILELCIEMLDNFVQQSLYLYSNPKFKEHIKKFIHSIVEQQIETIYDEYNEDEFSDFIDEMTSIVYNEYFTIMPNRCDSHKESLEFSTNLENIKSSLETIERKNNDCPAQRTDAWYDQRHNILSASSIWKAFDTQANKNALIVDKCKPISHFGGVNINSPFHWGQKYEPLSTMLYEHMFDAKINEYGCIPHSKYSFLGASPDGINVCETSPTYGRMLEIKNIVNRDITGIPKKEYWVQTQLQMEVCNLEYCDFFETRFKEYETSEDFYKDGDSFSTRENGHPKGIIMFFYKNDSPHYEYHELYKTKDDFIQWETSKMEEHKDSTWVKNIYWYLDEYSCVCIQRNKEWFEHIYPQLESIWETIKQERITGYEHRLPKKRAKKTITVNKVGPHNEPTDSKLFQNKLIIKIDTT